MNVSRLLVVALISSSAIASPAIGRAAPFGPAGCGELTAPASAIPDSSDTVGAASWTTSLLTILDEEGNTGSFGSLGGNRAALVTTSGARTWFTRTLDAGDTWSQDRALSPSSADVDTVTASFTGSHIDVASAVFDGPVLYRHSADRGRTWSPTVRVALGDSGVQVARGPGGIVALAAYSDNGFVVRVSTDDGASFGPRRVVGQHEPGSGCEFQPGRVALAVGSNAIVVSFWRSTDELVTRRSTNRGATWSRARILSRSAQGHANALVAHGSAVLAVYGSGSSLRSRYSTDGGLTWSTASLIATRSFDVAVSWSGGGWQLVDARSSLIRYRASADGLHWTAPQVLSNDADWYPTPLGAAVLTRATLVPFISYHVDLDQEWILLASR